MSTTPEKDLKRPFFPVPEYVSNPAKLAPLAEAMQVDPGTLLHSVEEDYLRQALTHYHIYAAEGPEKGGLLVHILQQCKELAAGFEQEQDGPPHLSDTLAHVQAQLAVLVAGYEEQLRELRGSQENPAPRA